MIEINIWLNSTAFFLIAAAFTISIISIIKFPSILVKLIILEVLINLLMAIIALWALVTQQAVFIDICLTLALITFLGIVAYYQFLLKRNSIDA